MSHVERTAAPGTGGGGGKEKLSEFVGEGIAQLPKHELSETAPSGLEEITNHSQYELSHVEGPFRFWKFDESILKANPGSGFFRLNNTEFKTTTHLFLCNKEREGVSSKPWIEQDALVGSALYLVQTGAGNVLARYKIKKVTSEEAGAWWDLEVEWLGGEGTKPGAPTIPVYFWADGGITEAGVKTLLEAYALLAGRELGGGAGFGQTIYGSPVFTEGLALRSNSASPEAGVLIGENGSGFVQVVGVLSVNSISGLEALNTGSLTVEGPTKLEGNLILVPTTPAELKANTSNYEVVGGTWQRLKASIALNLTGIKAKPAGSQLILTNIGTKTITLVNQSTSSTEPNRFKFASGSNIELTAGQMVTLLYDGATARWRDQSRSLIVRSVLLYGADPTGVADSTAAFEAAAKAGNIIYAPEGTYLINGVIELGGKTLYGDGYASTKFTKNSEVATMFTVKNPNAELRSFSIENLNKKPTSGAFIKITANGAGAGAFITITDMRIEFPFHGIEVSGGLGNQPAGINMTSIWVHNYQGAALKLASTITKENQVSITLNSFWFFAEVGSGEGSGFPCGILMEGNVEGCVFENGEIIQGEYGLVTKAEHVEPNFQPAFCRVSDCFFDSMYPGAGAAGVDLQGSTQFSFENCWFASKRGGGVRVKKDCTLMTFTSSTFIGCGTYGARVEKGAEGVKFGLCSFLSNSSTVEKTNSGLEIEAGTEQFLVADSDAYNIAGFLGKQLFGILVEAGTSDFYSIVNGRIENLEDKGTGENKTIASPGEIKTKTVKTAGILTAGGEVKAEAKAKVKELLTASGGLTVEGALTLPAESVPVKDLVIGAPEVAAELKANTKIKGIASRITTVYISAIFKAETTTGEIIADGKTIYKLLPETLATSSKVIYFTFKMRATAEFELKLTEGALEGATSVYVLQEG